MTDPFATPERLALAATVRGFVADHVRANLPEWEAAGELPLSLHRTAARLGLLGVGFAEDVGGSGGNAIDLTVTLEELLRAGGSGGLMAALFTHGIATPHVVDEAQRRTERGDSRGADYLIDRFVRPVLAGETIAALAVTEPDGGSDVARIRTRARRAEHEAIVSGAKTYITSGSRADYVVAAVRTGGQGASGVSLAVIESNRPGFTVSRRLEKLGWHCSDTAELSFADVRVPTTNVLGDEQGFASLARHFATERLTLAITGYATAQRCLDLTLEWCRNRNTFGRPLITRQVVRHQLVEMHRVTDVARRYVRDVSVRHSAGDDVTLDALLAKQTAVEACEYVVDRAVQLHGGAGYMRDSEVERHYRDARILGIGGGATEVMTDLAARFLL